MRYAYRTPVDGRTVCFTYTLDAHGAPAEIMVVGASGSTAFGLIERLGEQAYQAMRELAQLRVARSCA